MIGPFAAGTTDPLVAKNLTKFFVYAFVISIAILWYLEAKFDYGYFTFFCHWGPMILHKKWQVISSKIEEVAAIFVINILTSQ